MKHKTKTKDKIVQAVIKKIDERSLIGQKKYGATMYNEIQTGKKDLTAFLNDVQEEIMDALLYIEAAKMCLNEEIEEAMLKRNDYLDSNLNSTLNNIHVYGENI